MDTPRLREITTMSTMKKEIKRYQNPELFERLSMEYAIGIMHGGARKRFETLMEKHLYLKATTEAYEHQFARLADLLPEEQPNPRVWKRVEKQASKSSHKKEVRQKTSTVWWQSLPMKMAGFAATVFFAVAALFLFNSTQIGQPVYASSMESDAHDLAATVMAKSDMGIEVKLAANIDVPSDMKLTLWCISKNPKEAPMMMGDLKASGRSIIKLDQKMWNGLADVSSLAISLEPANIQSMKEPQGKVLYKGALKLMSEHS